MNAAHSLAAEQQPATTESLSDTLRSVAAGPVPANQRNAERQRLREENARYFATHRGMACLLRDLNDDHGRLLQRVDYLLSSIADAACEDGDWAHALCHIGSTWMQYEKTQHADFRALADAACTAAAADEGDAA